jgi:hypothetical protein
MPETGHKAATDYVEIDHAWVSHQHVPIYEWTFPPEASDEELDAFVRAREEWAQLQLDVKIAECRAHSRVRASRR